MFYTCIQKIEASGQRMPSLLRHVAHHVLSRHADLDARAAAILGAWDAQHAIPMDMAPWLQSGMRQISVQKGPR